jgi:hypothetical protein
VDRYLLYFGQFHDSVVQLTVVIVIEVTFMNMKKLVWMAGLMVALGIGAVPSYADLLSFQDDDVEAILRCTNPATGTGCAVVSTGPIQVNDVFYSVFEIPTFEINGNPAIPAGQELTGVAAIQLLSINGSTYTFGTFSGLNAVLDTFGYTGTDLNAGAVIAMYLNGTAGGGDIDVNLDRSAAAGAVNCGTVVTCSFQATLGNLLQVDGFGVGATADADNFWVATVTPGGGNIDTVAGTNNALLVASANFALSNLFNASGPIGFQNILSGAECPAGSFALDGCAQFVGSVTVTGGAGLTGSGFFAHSDFDAQKYSAAPIPEPGTVSLLGLGLLGLAALRMRKKA